MSHSVEDFYKKCGVLHEKAVALHRERYKISGSYDEAQCKHMVSDIRAIAQDIIHGPVDLDIDFGKNDIQEDPNTRV